MHRRLAFYVHREDAWVNHAGIHAGVVGNFRGEKWLACFWDLGSVVPQRTSGGSSPAQLSILAFDIPGCTARAIVVGLPADSLSKAGYIFLAPTSSTRAPPHHHPRA